MGSISLTADQLDAMQEITNIGMGQAGSVLAVLLGTFVNLSVPRINVLPLSGVPESISRMVGDTGDVTAVRQSFQGGLTGEAIAIFGHEGCKELGDLMGYDAVLDRTDEVELLLDVSNVLIGACLNGIVDQIKVIADFDDEDAALTFSAPLVMAEGVAADELIKPEKVNWTHALLLEVNFTLEERNFRSHLCVLMPEYSIEKMAAILDEFLSEF